MGFKTVDYESQCDLSVIKVHRFSILITGSHNYKLT